MKKLIIVEKDQKIRDRAKYAMTKQISSVLGICEQLRCIYDTVYDLPESDLKTMIIEQLVDASIMAEKMAKRLSYYYGKYHDFTGHDGKDLIQLTHNRERWKMRRTRK